MRKTAPRILSVLLGTMIAASALVALPSAAHAGVAYAYVPGANYHNCEQQASRYMQRQAAAGYKAATRTPCALNSNGIWVSKVTLAY